MQLNELFRNLSSEKKNKKLKFITYFLLLCPRRSLSPITVRKWYDNPYREYLNQNQNWRKPLKSSIN